MPSLIGAVARSSSKTFHSVSRAAVSPPSSQLHRIRSNSSNPCSITAITDSILRHSFLPPSARCLLGLKRAAESETTDRPKQGTNSRPDGVDRSIESICGSIRNKARVDRSALRKIISGRVKGTWSARKKEQLKSSRQSVWRSVEVGMKFDELLEFPIQDASFTQEMETVTLVDDCVRTEAYHDIVRQIDNQLPEPLSNSDALKDVATSALRAEIMDLRRPKLVNELSEFKAVHMLKRSCTERLLRMRCVKNEKDANTIDRYLDSMPHLAKLRVSAPMPPEVMEPLMAFRGDTVYSADCRVRINQKMQQVVILLKKIQEEHQNEKFVNLSDLETIIRKVTQLTEFPSHPFKNNLGFDSTVPEELLGGNEMGRPSSSISLQERVMRYPTLQRVAHSLRSTGSTHYAAALRDAIDILERQSSWSFGAKLEFVRQLRELLACLRTPMDVHDELELKSPLVPREHPKTKIFAVKRASPRRWKLTRLPRSLLTSQQAKKRSKSGAPSSPEEVYSDALKKAISEVAASVKRGSKRFKTESFGKSNYA